MRKLLLASALVSVLASGAALAAGALDGKTFTVEIGKKGKAKGGPDELIFADGKLRSTSFEDPASRFGANGRLKHGLRSCRFLRSAGSYICGKPVAL